MNEMRTIDNNLLLGEICHQLSKGKKVKLRAKGNSMRPFIHGGDDILVIAPSDNMHKGDVALARIEGKRYVIHRIITMQGDSITLMGDSNLYDTEACSRKDIYGTVETIIRNGKERNLKPAYSSMMWKIWRFLLPLRRLIHKTFQKFRAPTTPASPA